ncbi:MAG: hypothetical protein WCH21_11550 [Bacteroidota bacterium]
MGISPKNNVNTNISNQTHDSDKVIESADAEKKERSYRCPYSCAFIKI